MARLSDSITYGNHAITGDVNVGGTLTIGGVVYQQVNLTGGTNVTVSGTYPNLTLSSVNTNTTYTAGTGITLTGTSFSLTGDSFTAANYLGVTAKAADSDKLDGLHLNSTTRNTEANRVCRTDSSGYANFGWINTTSGATSGTLTDIFVNTGDGYIRKASLAHVKTQMGIGTNANRALFISTAEPTAGQGADGDVWYTYS